MRGARCLGDPDDATTTRLDHMLLTWNVRRRLQEQATEKTRLLLVMMPLPFHGSCEFKGGTAAATRTADADNHDLRRIGRCWGWCTWQSCVCTCVCIYMYTYMNLSVYMYMYLYLYMYMIMCM